MHPGLRAVAFAPFTVALRAFVEVELAGEAQIGLGRLERVLKFLEFIGDDPGFVLLGGPVDDENADESEKRGEGKFAESEILWRDGGHADANSRISRRTTEGRDSPNFERGF